MALRARSVLVVVCDGCGEELKRAGRPAHFIDATDVDQAFASDLSWTADLDKWAVDPCGAATCPRCRAAAASRRRHRS